MLLRNLSIVSRSGYLYVQKNSSLSLTSNCEHGIMMTLFSQGQLTQEDLANRLLRDKGTIARSVANLEKKNLVTRTVDQNNRRQNVISLSSDGKKLVESLYAMANKWEEHLTVHLTEDEKNTLKSLTEKILPEAFSLIQAKGLIGLQDDR